MVRLSNRQVLKDWRSGQDLQNWNPIFNTDVVRNCANNVSKSSLCNQCKCIFYETSNFKTHMKTRIGARLRLSTPENSNQNKSRNWKPFWFDQIPHQRRAVVVVVRLNQGWRPPRGWIKGRWERVWRSFDVKIFQNFKVNIYLDTLIKCANPNRRKF